MKLESKAVIQIQKPIEDVFQGIVNPEKMTKCFIWDFFRNRIPLYK